MAEKNPTTTTRRTAAGTTQVPAAGATTTTDASGTSTRTAADTGGTNVEAFDSKGNKQAIRDESAARAAGQTVKTSEYTVLSGQSVIQGERRFEAGEKIQLSEADAARLVDRMVVGKGADASKAARELAAKQQAEADLADPDNAANVAQRQADEQAAADREARNLADGKLSGAENR